MTLSSAEYFRIAKALSDPQRCEILEKMASTAELCCSDFVSHFQLSQATISHHLKELATAGLVERRKDGQFAFYRFLPDVLLAYVAELTGRLHIAPEALAAITTNGRVAAL